MYIVGFSGPPRSGKDTAAKLFTDILERHGTPTQIVPLSLPMRKMAFAALGQEYDSHLYERIKDNPLQALGGDTLRRFMIRTSEEFMKPRYGGDIWAKLLWQSLRHTFPGVVVIPDFGFQVESSYFQLALGSERVMAVQVAREGKDFSNDSRSYVGADRNFSVENNGSLEELSSEMWRLARYLRNRLGWTI